MRIRDHIAIASFVYVTVNTTCMTAMSGDFAFSPDENVQRHCSFTEIDALFYPRGKGVERLQGMVCGTMAAFLRIGSSALPNSWARARTVGGLEGSLGVESSVTERCWQAVAQYWASAKVDAGSLRRIYGKDAPVAAIWALKTGLKPVIESWQQPKQGDACSVNVRIPVGLVGHMHSLQEIIFAQMSEARCSSLQHEAELERYAAVKLSRDFDNPLYSSCGGGQAKEPWKKLNRTARQALKVCELLRSRMIDWLADQPGPRGYDQCHKAHEALTGELPGCIDALIKCERQQGKGHIGCSALRACADTITTGCDDIIVAAGEKTHRLCPLPRGLGMQTDGTCTIHSMAAALYMSATGCPIEKPRAHSIGELYTLSGSGNPDHSLEPKDTVALVNRLKGLGRNIALRDSPIDEKFVKAHVPMIVTVAISTAPDRTVAVGDLRSSRESLKRRLLLNRYDIREENPDWIPHSMFISDTMTQAGRTYAVVRDANLGYEPYLLPIENLVAANEAFISARKGLAISIPPAAIRFR